MISAQKIYKNEISLVVLHFALNSSNFAGWENGKTRVTHPLKVTKQQAKVFKLCFFLHWQNT